MSKELLLVPDFYVITYYVKISQKLSSAVFINHVSVELAFTTRLWDQIMGSTSSWKKTAKW